MLIPLAVLAAWRIPVTYPEGDFVMNALDVSKTGHVSSTFTPDTYPYLAGSVYAVAGLRGFLLAQGIVYLLLAWAVLWLIRVMSLGVRAALIAAMLVCADPDLLASIPKVWDTELTALLLLTFTSLCVLALRQACSGRLAPGLLLTIATVWGVGASVRPNFALLLLPILYVLAASREKVWVLWAMGVAGWGWLTLALVNTVTHGSFYVAQNGPYNFFAGANPYTQAALLRLLNAEASVAPALAALGVHLGPDNDAAYRVARATYMHDALSFVGGHPLQWLWLCGVKLVTLLRADTKTHAMFTFGWLIKGMTALCVPVWLAILVLLKKMDRRDRLILIVVASYILPFLLTNADPRFRTPLDALVLAHAASLIVRKMAGGSRGSDESVTVNSPTSVPIVAV